MLQLSGIFIQMRNLFMERKGFFVSDLRRNVAFSIDVGIPSRIFLIMKLNMGIQ
jgi:hypothetical protein